MSSMSLVLSPAVAPAAIVGAGVLGLPYAMSFLGWAGGTVTLALSWVSDAPHLWLVLLRKHLSRDVHCPLPSCLWLCSGRWHCLWPKLCCCTTPLPTPASAAWLALAASCVSL